MRRIIGREKESDLLYTLKSNSLSSFAALYGRRRVGKTFLVRQVFANQFDFYLTGIANVNTQHQLSNFHAALIRYDISPVEKEPASDWFTAFRQLAEVLEAGSGIKKIIFLDELPWLDTPQSNFIPALEHFWNSWASARNDVLLIVCGSAAAWMINKLINNKGGLHNRITHRMKLEPFTLRECELFFRSRSAFFDRYQLIQLYMAFGGIPFYLELVDTQKSAAQNISEICFDPNGLLRNEFENLYRSLFNKPGKHIDVIEALSKKNKGLTRDDLIKQAKLPNGGGTTRILEELEESGFIRKYASFDKKGKYALYQLSDFYSFFYLKWINGVGKLDRDVWLNEIDSPKQRAWSGYAFEQVCLAHINEIKQALGVSGIQTVTGSWVNSNADGGAQIDLVIDRRDHVINIFEIKFSINHFTIDKKYAQELRNKLSVFKEQTGTRKAVCLTMITSFGLHKNEYASSLVQKDLTMDVLFGRYGDNALFSPTIAHMPMSQPLIRKGRSDDMARILSLYKKVSRSSDGLARTYEEMTEEYVMGFVTKALQDGVLLVMEDAGSGEVIGEVHCYKLTPKVFGHILSELTIAIDPDHQGRGDGKELIQALLKEVSENRTEILRIELIARESNTKAIEFYQRLGFVIEGRLLNRIKAGGSGFEADIPMSWMNANYLT
jgi:ribosomal protein S18 acetylase RimI-like enzyme/AAA+ ATPase superfamily predicted ATPase